MSNYITIKLRRGTAAQWTATNPVLAEGEVGLETDTRKFKVGTGAAAWNSLQYWGGSGGAADFIDLGDVPASYAGAGSYYVKVKETADGLEFEPIEAADLPSGIDAAKIANGTISNTEFQTLNGAEQPFTNALKTKLDGIEAGADVTDADNVGAVLNAATAKTTPVDADTIPLSDSAASGALKKLSWANLKATAKTYFDTIYQAALGYTPANKAGETFTGNISAPNLSGTNTGDQTISLTGDVTGSGTGSFAATIANDAVTYAKIQNVSAASQLLGRGSTGSGDVQEITLGTNLSMSGTTLNATGGGSVAWGAITGTLSSQTDLQTALDGKVDENTAITGATKTKITYDAKGLVTAGADAAIADITGLQTALDGKTDDAIVVNTNTTAANDQLYHVVASATFTDPTPVEGKGYVVFVRNGTATVGGTGYSTAGQLIWRVFHSGAWANYLYWASTIPTAGIADDAVTNAKLANMDTARFKARITAGSGDPEDLTGTQATTLLDTFTSSLKGLAPASGGGTTNFLRADGTWAAPPGGGGGGTAITLNQNFNQVGPVNTTTETAIFSYALPTNLVAGDTLQLNLAGLFKNNSGAARTVDMYFKLGATTIMSHNLSLSASATDRTGSMLLNLFIVATNSQKMSVTSWSTDAAAGAMGTIQTGSRFFNSLGYGTAAEDLTSAKTLQVTVRFLSASADLYCYSQAATLVKFPKP